MYRIRVGRRIGSAALVADGVHARADGFTSLAVVAGVVGVWAGFPAADPIVGLLIAAAILVLLVSTARDVGRRLLDAVDPALTDSAEHALTHTADVRAVEQVRVRWSGHQLHVQALIHTDPAMTVARSRDVLDDAERHVRDHLPRVGAVVLSAVPSTAADEERLRVDAVPHGRPAV